MPPRENKRQILVAETKQVRVSDGVRSAQQLHVWHPIRQLAQPPRITAGYRPVPGCKKTSEIISFQLVVIGRCPAAGNVVKHIRDVVGRGELVTGQLQRVGTREQTAQRVMALANVVLDGRACVCQVSLSQLCEAHVVHRRVENHMPPRVCFGSQFDHAVQEVGAPPAVELARRRDATPPDEVLPTRAIE